MDSFGNVYWSKKQYIFLLYFSRHFCAVVKHLKAVNSSCRHLIKNYFNTMQSHLCYTRQIVSNPFPIFLFIKSAKTIPHLTRQNLKLSSWVLVELQENCEWLRVLAALRNYVGVTQVSCVWRGLKLLLLTAGKFLELLLQGDGGVVGTKDLGCQAIHQLLQVLIQNRRLQETPGGEERERGRSWERKRTKEEEWHKYYN